MVCAKYMCFVLFDKNYLSWNIDFALTESKILGILKVMFISKPVKKKSNGLNVFILIESLRPICKNSSPEPVE